MDKKSKRSSSLEIQSPSSIKAPSDSQQAGNGSQDSPHRGSWIREDGAICFDNECIVLKSDQDGALDLIYNPDKCSCEESNDAILNALASAAISGKGIRLEIKPKAQK